MKEHRLSSERAQAVLFPSAQVKDGAKSPQDRRAEEWVAGVSETVELAFADLTEGFDFDLPKQKDTIPDAEALAGGPEEGPDAPTLVASNDDAVTVGIIEEARAQNEKRGKDGTFTSGAGSFIPFKRVDKAKRPDLKFDHGFLDDGKGNLDPSKKKDPELSDLVAYMKWDAKVSAAEMLRPDLIDATRAYRNFLMATGFPLVFDYEKYVEDDRAGKVLVESAIEDTIAAALEISDISGDPGFVMQTEGIAVGARLSSRRDGIPFRICGNLRRESK